MAARHGRTSQAAAPQPARTVADISERESGKPVTCDDDAQPEGRGVGSDGMVTEDDSAVILDIYTAFLFHELGP